ncbi:energy-dependent translational throttle protein EttA [Chromobacterium subtsugae]|uniref:Energy-dependent translational throttle protein EttA n=1 Tax=Chromobacterium subtsugae TaxID=251747 RepID=A0ABS7FAB9_9NEIS|nr:MULTISPECIES: energy-dependent translational throttle protein EttA [Chromobacterium]KUM04577.1 ABC transporter ATP-binding protein [Chromobacterium subtsugae]KZE87364.1 energy-dependent translational throttle protein EttA [Chromobacterium sp. F49]MBW7565930.1 energy-dependent translational throttle protein EttA [Chromobacterium subtsugae]MBW8287030.1 energy-dependent translational throttle protein EttA [Chromobacterium subtsugae]WSE93872.1 energy-dependent translational throttle protein Ett
MAQYVMSMLRVSKIVPPKRQIIKDISLSFFPGAKIGLLGLNGAGKSTVLRIMANVDKEYDGEVQHLAGVKIGYLEQEPKLDNDKTVREEVESGMGDVMGAQKRLEEVYAAYAEPDADFDALAEEQAKLEAIISAGAGDNVALQLELAADALRLPPWDAKIGPLSGGEKRRVALCKLLLSKPDMLLLDEPTNHLDAESVEWLEQFLVRFPGTVVAVTHDRYFLDNAAEWILELDRGEGIPWKGNYSSWLEQKEERLAQEAKSEGARMKAMKQELEWVRQNPKGRQAKSKARIARFEELSSYETQKRNETQEIFIPVAERLGNEVIEFDSVSKGFGDRLLIDNLSFKAPPGAIVGIIGPNGAGKSTLFKMIAGKEQPDSGSVKIGQTVQMAFVEQSREGLDGDKTVFEDVAAGADILTVGRFEMSSRAYLGRFNFKGADQQKKVGMLSGGERGRLHLAKTLLKGGNVLLLDEPSNDLDVETLRALEDALLEYAGTVFVISHDRWFLDRIATHILAAEGESQWTFFDGNYQEYEADKKKRLGEEGAKPKRIRYKPISR